MSARLAVTGVGLVTALGANAEATWARLLRGDRAIGPVRGFDATGQRVAIAAEAAPTEVVSPGGSRTSALAASACAEALAGARLLARDRRVGLVVATTTGGMLETEELLAALHVDPRERGALEAMLSHPLSVTAERLDERLGPFARTRTVSSACSSGALALVVAASWLLEGELDAVVACASDALCRLTLSGFNALGALDPEACRPFDRRRRGTTLGEGAAALVLERSDGAMARGAAALAELRGWAVGAEAYHVIHPAPDGVCIEALVRRALDRAGLGPEDLDHVSAHGTGTPVGDPIEAGALGRALGAETERVPVSSSKGQLGHTLGAAGAIDAVIATLAIAGGALPPTGGLEERDPSVALVLRREAREGTPVRAALVCALGFGGMDAVLVLATPGARGDSGGEAPPVSDLVITGASVLSGLDAGASLDEARARRIDAGARLGVATIERALRESRAPAAGTGVVMGSAFGCVDGSAEFMHRIFERGPRAARPVDFPGLVPSALVGHASIYLGLTGPTFATAALSSSGESAFHQALSLVASGEAPRMIAGSAEPRSDIVERVLGALFGGEVTRRDLAAALVIESRHAALARSARILARVRRALEWRGDGRDAMASLGAPAADLAEVVLTRESPAAVALLEGTAWASCPRVIVPAHLGPSDALGAAALCLGARRLAEGATREALVVGVGERQGSLVLLSAP